MTTVANLLTDLQNQDPAHPLIFMTDEGEIGAGYHVTELRHSFSKGIDCGGNIESWQETRLQLLDGQGVTHMSVGKFGNIVKKSLSSLPELADAPLLIEFGHGNNGLTLMSLDAPEVQGDTVVLRLGDARAVCKPAQRTKSTEGNLGECCSRTGNSTPETPCCPNVKPPTRASSCCA